MARNTEGVVGFCSFAKSWWNRIAGKNLQQEDSIFLSEVSPPTQEEDENDEFRPSLDMNARLMFSMSEKERDEYIRDLLRRREIAHQRDLERDE